MNWPRQHTLRAAVIPRIVIMGFVLSFSLTRESWGVLNPDPKNLFAAMSTFEN
jgi:hypothetical protein